MVQVPGSHDEDKSFDVTFDDEAVFELRPGVEAARHVDGITVRHPETGAYFSLNGTAVFVWELLGQANSLSVAKLAAAEQYGAPREATDATIDAFVADLVAEGLLMPKSIVEEGKT